MGGPDSGSSLGSWETGNLALLLSGDRISLHYEITPLRGDSCRRGTALSRRVVQGRKSGCCAIDSLWSCSRKKPSRAELALAHRWVALTSARTSLDPEQWHMVQASVASTCGCEWASSRTSGASTDRACSDTSSGPLPTAATHGIFGEAGTPCRPSLAFLRGWGKNIGAHGCLEKKGR